MKKLEQLNLKQEKASGAGGLEKIFSPTVVLATFMVLALAGYVLFQHWFFGLTVFVLIIALFATDLFYSGKGKRISWKQSFTELVVALAAAGAAWLALCFVLNTSSPLNVVTSCSMVPVLERGDFIILQGGEVNAPEVVVNEFLSNAASNPVPSIRTLYAGKLGKQYLLYYTTVVNGGDLLNYSFRECLVETSDKPAVDACFESASIKGIEFYSNKSNDVIVYDAVPEKYGLIIHRVIVKVRAPDGVFYLTKGDNNLFADQQSGIALVPQQRVKGKVLLRIPYVGFLKLFLFMQFEPPPGCGQRITPVPEGGE